MKKYLVLIGRALYSLLFILASFGHFSSHTIGYAAGVGVPFSKILVPLSGVMLLAGGLSVLLGYRAKVGALLIVLFLIPTTFIIHKFWGITDPMRAGIEQAMFLKNISLIGAALLIMYFGSGPFSLSKK